MSVKQMSLVWDLDLEPNKKIVLLAYADHADEDGDNVYPSLPRIAHKTGYSKDQVRRISRELVESDLMVLVQKGVGRGNPHRYKLTLEKGSTLPSFKAKPKTKEKVASKREKVASAPVKGSIAMPPEPSIENHQQDIEPSVIPTGGKTASVLNGSNRTESQRLTDDFYNRLKGRYDCPLEPEQYSYHLGHFRNMLKKYEPTEQEVLRVIAYMVDRYPGSKKIRATTAIQDVRLGRDTGEAWEGPPPWEKNREKSYYEKRYPDADKDIDPEQKAIMEENQRMLAELLEGVV